MIFQTKHILEGKSIGGLGDNFNAGKVDPKSYKAPEPGSIEANARNLDQAKISSGKIDTSGVQVRQQLSRKDVMTGQGRFILEWFQKTYKTELGDLAESCNYQAIAELANRSELFGPVFRAKVAEYKNSINFPEWAASNLSQSEIDGVRKKMSLIAQTRSERALKEANLSANIRGVRTAIDEVYTSKINAISKSPDGSYDWLPFIFSYPSNRLPLKHILQIIQYASEESNATPDEIKARGENYVTSDQYEEHVLDEFRKEMFLHYKSNKEDMKSFFQKYNINFIDTEKTVSDKVLSGIETILENSETARDKLGLPGSVAYINRSLGKEA